MGINPFRRSVISKIKTDSFKGKIEEKTDLARKAGSRGFSPKEMEERLKEDGYNKRKRQNIMGQVLKNKSDGLTEQQKRRNIMASRAMASMEGETSARVTGYGSFAGRKVETKSRVMNRGEIGKATNRFGLSGGSSSQGNTPNPPAPIPGGMGPNRFL